MITLINLYVMLLSGDGWIMMDFKATALIDLMIILVVVVTAGDGIIIDIIYDKLMNKKSSSKKESC